MPGTFVLVHGGFHGGWCYARVGDLLRADGHRVFTPTLTGLGERSHLLRADVNCSTHVQDVLNVIKWERLSDVVLCGHSFGGMVISGVADRIPEQIAALVYLDAAVPEPGVPTQNSQPSADAISMMGEISQLNGVPVVNPLPAAVFKINAADEAMVDELCTPQPAASFLERLSLSGAYLRVPKKLYVRAAWDVPSIEESYRRIKGQPGWSTIELSCGHEIMLDEPERLAEILLGML